MLALAAVLAVAGCAAPSTRDQAAAPFAAGRAAGSAVRVKAATPATPIARPSTASTASTSSTPVTTVTAPPPPPNACAANSRAQLVLVSIRTQTAWMCAGSTLAYATPVTTGETDNGDDTPIGTWHVESRQTNRYLTLSNGVRYYVHYWLPFQAEVYGFHDASWQRMPYGSDGYHAQGSHGCVHLPLAAMAWLYTWAKVGATVTVRA
jgi:lipoprotein-anchoring transpeptidase ErfK/SrfK